MLIHSGGVRVISVQQCSNSCLLLKSDRLVHDIHLNLNNTSPHICINIFSKVSLSQMFCSILAQIGSLKEEMLYEKKMEIEYFSFHENNVFNLYLCTVYWKVILKKVCTK